MRCLKILKKLHSDQQGAEGLEKLLIIAAIVLPLLGVLLYFRSELTDWVTSAWDSIRGEAGNDPTYG